MKILKNTAFIQIVLFAIQTQLLLSQELTIDHVILTESDSNTLVQKYEQMGFTVKQGSKHQNGLINAHIKFLDSGAIELMSLYSEPKDELAKEYASLIKQKIKGAYIAFSGQKTTVIASILGKNQIEHTIQKEKWWTYVTFPKSSGFAPLFFIEYHRSFPEQSENYLHRNGMSRMAHIELQGNRLLSDLLEYAGLTFERISENKVRFKTASEDVILNEIDSLQSRIKIQKIVLHNDSKSDTLQIELD